MTAVEPLMLWESTDPLVALHQRFAFADPAHATSWLMQTVTDWYPVSVHSVDRLVISAANLLAWLTTNDGPYLAKCCAVTDAHTWLSQSAALLVWLHERHIPVALPRPARSGERQIRHDHLTLGLQPVIVGQLLDPCQLDQARIAGVILARIHAALAAYPHAEDFRLPSPLEPLATSIMMGIAQRRHQFRDPILIHASAVIEEQLQQWRTSVLESQLVHGDYRAANILWHSGAIAAVLDFEEQRWGYRVNDLTWAAVHLGTRFHHWGPVDPAVHAAFFDGYESQWPLNAQERTWVPLLMLWHTMSLACTASAVTAPAAIESVQCYMHQLQTQLVRSD